MSYLICKFSPIPGKSIQLLHGDITSEIVDAIVNAANSQLLHGGGVAGAILQRGGYNIQIESSRLAPVPVGQCVMTGPGRLTAKGIIHAVGPRWGEGNEDEKLYSAIENSLKMADNHRFKTISFPAVSSGIFGFPKERCAKILIQCALDFYENNIDTSLLEIRFCIVDRLTLEVFEEEFERVMNPRPQESTPE